MRERYEELGEPRVCRARTHFVEPSEHVVFGQLTAPPEYEARVVDRLRVLGVEGERLAPARHRVVIAVEVVERKRQVIEDVRLTIGLYLCDLVRRRRSDDLRVNILEPLADGADRGGAV